MYNYISIKILNVNNPTNAVCTKECHVSYQVLPEDGAIDFNLVLFKPLLARVVCTEARKTCAKTCDVRTGN